MTTTIIIALAIAGLLVLAIRNIVKNKEKGACAGCSGCAHGETCPSTSGNSSGENNAK